MATLVVLLAHRFIVVVDLFFGEFAFGVPVAVAAVALAVFEVGFDGLLAVVPPLADDTVEAAVDEGVFGFGFAVGMQGTGGAGEGGVAEEVDVVFPDEVVVGGFDGVAVAGEGDEQEAEEEETDDPGGVHERVGLNQDSGMDDKGMGAKEWISIGFLVPCPSFPRTLFFCPLIFHFGVKRV